MDENREQETNEMNLVPKPVEETKLEEVQSAVQDDFVSEVPTKKSKKKRNIILAIVAVCLVVVGIFAAVQSRNAKIQAELEAEQQRQEEERQEVLEYNNMIDLMNALYTASWEGTAKAESVCVLTYNVWYDCIYDDYSDKDTSKYVEDDFNDGIANVYDDEDVQDDLESVSSSQDKCQSIMRELQDCPDELDRAYDAAIELNTAFNTLASLALSPEGNLTSYGDNEQEYVSEYLRCARALIDVLPSKKDVPYYDEGEIVSNDDLAFADVLNQSIDRLSSEYDKEYVAGIAYQGSATIYDLEGTATYLTEGEADVVYSIMWKTDEYDQHDVEQLKARLDVLYGEIVSDDPIMWYPTGDSDYWVSLITTDDDEIMISWNYAYASD